MHLNKNNRFERLERFTEQNEHRSWADIGSAGPINPLLSRYIAGYNYSIGCLREQTAKLITRAYPTVMTQIYFEFYGGLSEIRGQGDGFGQIAKAKDSSTTQAEQRFEIEKRTYIKQGLGSWFDIYQLASSKHRRPIKNFKIDLYPMAFYELFRCSPKELMGEDLQFRDLFGQSRTCLLLEEMEATNDGAQMINIVERYFVEHLLQQINQGQLEIKYLTNGKQAGIYPKEFTPPLPKVHETLSQQARHQHKSVRWLQKRYNEIYGMSFKQMQGNLRFQSAHQEIWQTMAMRQPISLTELAYRSGYFDQAHFIKEFKRYTGMTPGKYLKINFDEQSQYLWYW